MKTDLLLIPTKTTDNTNWIKPLNNYLLSIYGNTTDYQKDLANLNQLRRDIQEPDADITGIKLHLRYFSQLELLDLRVPMAAINKNKKLKFTWSDAFLPTSKHEQHALAFEKASVLFNLGSLLSKAANLKYKESQRSSSSDDGSFKAAIQYLQQAAGVFQFISENFLHAPSNDLKPATVKFLINLCLSQSQEIFTVKVIDGDLEQKKNSLISKLSKSTANHYQECFSVCAHLLTDEGAKSISEHSTFSIIESGLDDDDELALDSGDDEVGLDEYNPDKLGMPDSNVPANIYRFWIASLQFKLIYYESLSFYFHGLQLEAANKYGEAIAYLTKSQNILNEIHSLVLNELARSKGEEAYDILDNYKYQKDAVGIKLKDLTKDNDLIYNEIIPSLVTLAEPKPMDSSKVIPLNEIELFAEVNEYNYNNFLKNVVPIDIHELLSYYSEEKAQLLRNEIDEVDVSNKELSTFLEHLKLPEALINIKQIIQSNKELELGSGENESVQPETIGKVSEISSRFSLDNENRRTIAEIRKKIFDIIAESEQVLAGQYSVSSGRYREDLIKLKKSLYDAASSDSRLFALVDAENSELHLILGKGPSSQEFRGLFKIPEKNAAVPSKPREEISLLDIDDSQETPKLDSIESQISRLEDILNELNQIKRKKTNLIESMKLEIHEDDISDILMLNSKIKSTNEIKTVIFPKELEKFEGYGQELDRLISQQLDLTGELNEKWTQLTANPNVKDVQQSKTFKDQLIKQQVGRIDKFYPDWKKYTTGLSKGSEFYTQLFKFADNLKRTIQSEVQRGSLSDSMSGMNLSDNHTGASQARGYQSGQSFFQPNQGYAPQQQGFSQNTGTQHQQYSGQFEQQPRQALYQPGYASGQNNSQQFSYQAQPLQPQFLGFHSQPSQESSRPPALPPKSFTQPTQPQLSAPSRQNTSGSVNSHSGIPVQNPASQDSSGLIYDQPSAYQPNMYNYFLGQG